MRLCEVYWEVQLEVYAEVQSRRPCVPEKDVGTVQEGSVARSLQWDGSQLSQLPKEVVQPGCHELNVPTLALPVPGCTI